MDPQDLLDLVREACPEGFWARGVQLARNGNVVGQSQDDDDEDVVLRVAVPGVAVAFTVHLWPEDEDWSCDCPSDKEACAHVAAAVITWAQAAKQGRELPSRAARPAVRAPAQVGYRLQRTERGFKVFRVAVRHDDETPLDGNLASARVPALVADPADQAVEEVLRFHWGADLPREFTPRVLAALAECPDVRLDDEAIRVSGEPVVPIGRVEDAGKGFRVRIVRDPSIVEVLRNGAVLCRGPVLRPVGQGGLSAEQRVLLGRGLEFGPGEVGKLVSEVLPMLRARVPVEVHTSRLPTVSAEKPRLVLHTDARGEALLVRADVVYGDPPTARVVHGELVVEGKVLPIRDEKTEARLARQAGDELGLGIGLPSELRGESAVAFVDRLSGWRGERQGTGWQRFRRAPPLSPSVRIDGDRFNVDLGGVSAERLVQAWMAGESLVPTAEGWAPLPREWLERYGHLVADLLASREPDSRVPRHALLDLARLAQALDQPPPPALEGLRALAGDFSGIPVSTLPADLRAELRPYQRRGADWLAFLAQAGLGGILADDMGLGKTVQALCALRGRALVVAPTSVLHNWEREAARFRPGLRVCVYHGPGRALDRRADLTLTTYGLLRNDVDLLAGVEWGTVVLDEAQAVKNPESQVAQAAYRLRAGFRLTLTGTPIENRLDELWSQFHFLMPGFLGGRSDFRERYDKPVTAGDAGVAEHLRRRVRPFVLRRLKAEVAPDLPPRTEMVLYATLSTEERATYDAVRAASRETVVRELGAGGSVLAALEALLRLRQAACHPALLPGQRAETSSKVELLVDTLDEAVAEGHKALVFSQWTGMLDLVEPRLARAGIPHLRLDGSTRDRAAVVDRFQTREGPPVFLISLKAGGTGLNLTAADHVFLVDPWWNPAAEDQAADRAHRIGQDKPVMVYRLVAEDTVEERILALRERKRAIAEAALGSGAGGGVITREELLALLD